MNSKKLKQLEINISDTGGTSYRTIVDFEEGRIHRSGVVNYVKIDLQPAVLEEFEMNRLREKLSHLNINTLKQSRDLKNVSSNLYWQVVIVTEDETLHEIGIDQLPLEWQHFFRLLP